MEGTQLSFPIGDMRMVTKSKKNRTTSKSETQTGVTSASHGGVIQTAGSAGSAGEVRHRRSWTVQEGVQNGSCATYYGTGHY